MNTSYFAKYKGLNSISISIGKPKWYDGESYPQLYPTWDMVMEYKKTTDHILYTRKYISTILGKLDPAEVYNDLNDKVLLCWEKSTEFCHRQIVAKWIELNMGVRVTEI